MLITRYNKRQNSSLSYARYYLQMAMIYSNTQMFQYILTFFPTLHIIIFYAFSKYFLQYVRQLM